MATLGTGNLTLADWAKRLDPDGKTPRIVELLSLTNEILQDMIFIEGNQPTGHLITTRTGLPSVYWRLLNQGVQPSKSTTAQITETCGSLEAWSEVDCDLARLNGNTDAFRLSEAQGFIEAMNQEMAQTLFYGNSGTSPEEFTGLSVRYPSLTGSTSQNVLGAGGTTGGSVYSSIWLTCWGPNTVAGIFPNGSQAGLVHQNLGEVTVEMTAGLPGSRMRAFQDRWVWKCGIAMKDWRYTVRIPNVDLVALAALTGTQAVTASTAIIKLMARAIDRLPSLGMGTPVFYCNRTIMSHLRVMAMDKTSSVLGISEGLNQFGDRIQNGLNLLGVPIRICDSLLTTEAEIT